MDAPVRLLAEVAWTELDERPLVLVPIGSTEQHGPHLPLETDTLIATSVARALADMVGGYVAPSLSFGASGEHADFPGVVSIGTDVLTAVLVELVRSLSRWAGRVVFVNGHGGNIEALNAAVEQLCNEAHQVSWVPCTVTGDAHAGHTETSLLMHLAPWLVRAHRAAPGNSRPITELLPELRTRGVREMSANGILGDPTGATAAVGAELFEQMVENASHGL
jgi:mycofactocin system creatininase family protein